MNWIPIDIDNVQSGEVLAANFKAGTHGYTEKLIGYLYIDENTVCCEGDEENLEGCTHYIDINKYDIYP